MRFDPAVRKQIMAVSVGTLLLAVLMIGVFLVIGKFEWTVLTGAALGSLTGIANFVLMAVTIQKAADSVQPFTPEQIEEMDRREEEAEEPLTGSFTKGSTMSESARRSQRRIQLSYALRMLGMGAMAIIGAALPWFNTYAFLISLLFPTIMIRVIGLMSRKGG